LVDKGGTWIILFIIFFVIPFFTWIACKIYWENPEVFYNLLGRLLK
jgi:hypothetical protein